MNREQRRRAARRSPITAEDIKRVVGTTDGCPDCDADVTLRQAATGVWQLQVAHDGTCPTYRAMTRSTP